MFKAEQKSSTKKLRELLEDKNLYIAPGAYSPLVARLVERAGFRVIGTTGFGMSADLLGLPDLGLLSRDFLVQICTYMANTVTIPILVDAESGYGNALGVWLTVRTIEKTGVAGLFIEDQTIPPNCPFIQKPSLISREEMIGKIEAAVDARVDPDFVLIARTDAHGQEGIERARAYVKAGADMIKPVPRDLEEIRAFGKAVDVPLHLGYVPGQALMKDINFGELRKFGGYKIISFPVSPLFYATKQIFNLLTNIHDTQSDSQFIDRMTTIQEFLNLIGAEEFKKMAKNYLPVVPESSELK